MDLTVEEKIEIEIRLIEIQTIVNILPLIEEGASCLTG